MNEPTVLFCFVSLLLLSTSFFLCFFMLVCCCLVEKTTVQFRFSLDRPIIVSCTSSSSCKQRKARSYLAKNSLYVSLVMDADSPFCCSHLFVWPPRTFHFSCVIDLRPANLVQQTFIVVFFSRVGRYYLSGKLKTLLECLAYLKKFPITTLPFFFSLSLVVSHWQLLTLGCS